MKQFPLAEIMSQIRQQLVEVSEKANNDGAYMTFAECEIEFSFTIEDTGNGKFSIWLLELGGSEKQVEANRIKLKYVANEGRPFHGEMTPIGGPLDAPQRG